MKELVIITGMSGSGKTTVIATLEDLGYYIVENLPPTMVEEFIELTTVNNIDKVAIVIDLRVENFFSEAVQKIKKLLKQDMKIKIIYTQADDDTIMSRYKESRRVHPLGQDCYQAIQKEKEKLATIKGLATTIIDTTGYSIVDTRKYVMKLFTDSKDFTIILKSFGYKYETPKDADYIFDLRYIPNPYYVDSLRDSTGEDAKVANYVMQFDESQKTYQIIDELLEFTIPKIIDEGRLNLIICFGCSGGKHRSVTFVEKFNQKYKEKYQTKVIHSARYQKN